MKHTKAQHSKLVWWVSNISNKIEQHLKWPSDTSPCTIVSFSKQIGTEFAFTNTESYGLTHYVQLLHKCWTRPANDLALLIAGNMNHHLLCHWTTQPCHAFSLYIHIVICIPRKAKGSGLVKIVARLYFCPWKQATAWMVCRFLSCPLPLPFWDSRNFPGAVHQRKKWRDRSDCVEHPLNKTNIASTCF